MKSAKIRGTALFCLLLTAGCAGEPYTYVPENELKPGPGLFSGADGEITLINKELPDREEESAGTR